MDRRFNTPGRVCMGIVAATLVVAASAAVAAIIGCSSIGEHRRQNIGSSRRPTTSAGARRSPTGSSRSSARASCPLRRGRGCMRSPSSPTRVSWTTSLPRRTRPPLPPPKVDAAAARSPMPAQAAGKHARTARPPLKGRAVRSPLAGAMKTRDAASARIASLKGRQRAVTLPSWRRDRFFSFTPAQLWPQHADTSMP